MSESAGRIIYSRPLVVGVRQHEDRQDDSSPEAALADLGRNTGNMMFTEALVQVLEGSRWGSFGFSEPDLQDRDSIVLASANWINGFEDFGWLADRLEKTRLPVFLVGVGAQSSLDLEIPQVQPGTRRLLDLVKDRSTSIAARGWFTCEVIEKLGIKNVQETGCPSLMLAGPGGPQISVRSVSGETCCMHSTRHMFQQPDPFQQYLYRQAFKAGIDLVLQSELSDICYALDNEKARHSSEIEREVLCNCYGTDDFEAIKHYLRHNGHVFLKYADWISFMRTKTLCFGTRIHGTIASLIAGTPATLICHDSRTLEMAQSMFLPMMTSTDIDTDSDLTTSSFLLRQELVDFASSYPLYYARFLEYFASNHIAVAPKFRWRAAECRISVGQ